MLLLLLILFHSTDRKIEARETKQPTELINRVLWLMCYSKQSSDLEKGKRFSWIGWEVTGQGSPFLFAQLRSLENTGICKDDCPVDPSHMFVLVFILLIHL